MFPSCLRVDPVEAPLWAPPHAERLSFVWIAAGNLMANQRHDKNDHFEVVEKLRSDFLKREAPLLVTTSVTPIKAVFNKLGDVLQSRITKGTATEKALALEIQNKIKPDLLDDEIRAGIIDGLFLVAQSSIRAMLTLAKGKKLSSEVLPHLLRILMEQHRFEPALSEGTTRPISQE